MLSYITARQVMDRLDAVVGPENWQNRFTEVKGIMVCEIGIRTEDGWVWKSDGSDETDIEAEKGALSGALKRAAVHWGIGRSLYGESGGDDAPTPHGRVVPPTDKMRKYAGDLLAKALDNPDLNEWASSMGAYLEANETMEAYKDAITKLKKALGE
jgi:hypothetical protein